MSLPAFVTLLLLALALGAALGAWFVSPAPAPGVPLVPPAPPEPLPPPTPVERGLRARFLPPARLAAQALADAAPPVEVTADVLASVAADHWALGVSEFRAALLLASGLPVSLVEVVAESAIRALEGRHAIGAAPDPG